MTEESYYGTCLMNDGRLVTMSWDKLHQAFKRIMEWDCIISALKQNELRDMYLAACADTTALELRIEKSQSEYKAAIELVRVKREAAREAAAALKNAKNPTLKARKKVKINDIRVNTHVSMYFTWEELESTLPRPSTVPDADGMTDMADQWRTGTVTKIDQNKWRKKVYTCVFDTPGKFTSPYNAQEILVARENYLKLKTSYHGIVESSSDDFSATDEDSNLVTPPKQAAPKSNIVSRSVRKIAGPHLTIPGTQLEATTLVEHENVDKDTTNELFVHCLFDTGALNLLVVLGLRLNLSCIVARNSLNHCTALGPLDRYALAHVIVFLGTGSSTKYKNLRNDMLENGMNLAVRRNHVTNLQGTVMWTDALSQELQLIEAFYNHNGNESRMRTEYIHPPATPFAHRRLHTSLATTASATSTQTESLVAPTNERNQADDRLSLPCKICSMVNCGRLRCFIKLPREGVQLDEYTPPVVATTVTLHPSTQPPEAEKVKSNVSHVDESTGGTVDAPEVVVIEVSTTTQATKVDEEENMNTTTARLISESALEGRSTGTMADESVDEQVEPVLDTGETQDSRVVTKGLLDDEATGRQSMISGTKTGETTTGNVDTEGATKELLVDKDKERQRLELASLFNGAQPMTSTTITSHRKRTKKQGKKVSKLSLKRNKPASTKADNSEELPLGLYTDGNKQLRKRLFPCPSCHEPADGSHQCGGCYQHVHVCCATPFKDSPEGFGQIVSCGLCDETKQEEGYTQVWNDNDNEHDDNVNDEGYVGENNATTCGEVGDKNEPNTNKRPARGSGVQGKKAGAGGTKSQRRKRKHKEGKSLSKVPICKKSKQAPLTSLQLRATGENSNTVVNVESAAKELGTRTSDTSEDANTQMAHADPIDNEWNGETRNDDDYYWDEEYGSWVYMPQKRVRRRDLTNKKEKIWKLAMRRNWDTNKNAKMMEKITIKRDKLDTVTNSHLA